MTPTPPSPKRLLRNGLAFAAAALAIVGVAACDVSESASQSDLSDSRQVAVVGTGEVQGTPDTLTANISIEFIASDATTALNQTSERVQAVTNALADTAKIDRKDIRTTSVSLQPKYNPESSTITEYVSSNSIEVRIRKLDTASQVLALIQTTGANATRINSVNFSVDDDEQLLKDARTRAFDDAKARAEQYAQLSGLQLGQVISISEAVGGSTPVPTTPMPRPYAAAPVSLEPGQQPVSMSVTVIWELT